MIKTLGNVLIAASIATASASLGYAIKQGELESQYSSARINPNAYLSSQEKSRLLAKQDYHRKRCDNGFKLYCLSAVPLILGTGCRIVDKHKNRGS